jgi:hypothetical protein
MADEERFPIIRPPRLQSQPEGASYVNGVAITVSPWDFCLLFSRAIPTDPLSDDPGTQTGARGRHEVAMQGDVVQRIVMSPEHAKAMAAQLAQNVTLYENEFGEIPGPKPEPAATPKPRARKRSK